ncbi:MAG: PQQ-binding-like beta-propeller repeat protein [Bacteroidota bacterium]|nr:PQQ-binding-like beta-propeller repeat protein [Bacteroidota bacterium]
MAKISIALMKKNLTLLPLVLVILFSCKKNPSGTQTPNPFVPNAQHQSVTTQHNDNNRTGLNSNETVLTTTNVNSTQFGKLFSMPVDDQVFAQPLIVGGITMDGQVHNVAYIATVNNTVYAYDADNGNLFWKKNYTQGGMRPPRNTDMGSCGGVYEDFSGNIGIVGTPVIDSLTHTIYFVARSTDGNNNFVQYLHAVNILTGAEMAGSPVQINATYSGNGAGSTSNVLTFNPKTQNQRQALLLANGRVYISWSSHCDIGPYHGWILGYNAGTLQQETVYNDTPDGNDGGMWESGMGLAADNSGNIYAAVGNGTVGSGGDPTVVTNRGESALKLTPSGSTLTVASYFTPYNYVALNNSDLDFGSIGSLLIPNTNYYFTGSKDGTLYLLDKDNMGGYNNASNLIQQAVSLNNANANEHCQAAFYQGVSGDFLYVWSENDNLKAFPFDPGTHLINEAGIVASPVSGPTGQSGAMLSVSSNGTTAGTGILWAAYPDGCDAEHNVCPGILAAFDAGNVTHQLWNSVSTNDQVGNYAKFSAPTIANGHVYLATFSGYVDVYGLKTP